MRAPAELVRVVRRADGSLATGRTLEGRGAWMCAGSEPCFTEAVRRRSFARALRSAVSSEAVEALRPEFLARSPDRDPNQLERPGLVARDL